jgi:transposase InsO family protein
VVLALIGHGTRACLALDLLASKHSLRLFRVLTQTVKRFGTPTSLRTDNEAVFTSRLFRSAFKALGIRPQRSDKHCPWQNGRIERFFGTFKSVIRQVCVENR